MTINPAALTITANDASKTAGRTLVFAGTEFSALGLAVGDAVTAVTLTSPGADAAASAAASPYPIVPSAAVGSGLGNYLIAYQNGSLTVTPAAATQGAAVGQGAAFMTNGYVGLPGLPAAASQNAVLPAAPAALAVSPALLVNPAALNAIAPAAGGDEAGDAGEAAMPCDRSLPCTGDR